MMKDLMEETRTPEYLPRIIQTWEEKLGRGELRYTFPKHDTNSVSHFFQWVRWAKERVSYLGDKVPPSARPGGDLYPGFTVEFQEMLVGFILDDYTKGFVTRMTNSEWYDWMVLNRGRNHVLFQVMQVWPQFAELAIRTWEARVGNAPELRYKLPEYIQHFHPQRYVTLFLYLNNQTKVGGETVFPFSLDRYSDEDIVRDGMSECSTGLAVPPLGLHASLFYVQTPEGIPDVMSRHGGCPPHEGVKWGANSFMWDSDSEEDMVDSSTPEVKGATSKPPTKACSSSSIALKILSVVVIVLAIIGGWFIQQTEKFDEVALKTLRDTGLLHRVPSRVLNTIGVLPDKYETDLVTMQVRHLVSELKCNDSDYTATTLFDGKVFPVTEPMEAEQPMTDDRVFFMLNGANDGVYVSWNGQFECVGKAAEVAAAWLGADRDVMVNGVRLYNQMGWPWPGIKKGYKYVLEDGVTLTMVGTRPKVFDVEYFLTQAEADKIIELGSPHLARVARLASPSFVEGLQLVRYNAGEFYRKHLDTFASREFLPKGAEHKYGMNAYKEWANWAANKI
ncbi:Prolyl 4-hydroxylase, alpha subunit, partial [Phytophthora palmivora]